MKHGKLLETLPDPGAAAEEVLELFSGDGVRIERIVSNAHVSPEGFWYDQDQDEWVMILKGCAELEFEDGTCHEMAAGYWENGGAQVSDWRGSILEALQRLRDPSVPG